MKRRSLAAAFIIALLFAPALDAPAALACTPDPDYNPVRDSDVVVLGRVSHWSEAEYGRFDSQYDPIRLEVQVSRVFKGDVPQTLDLYEGRSLSREGGMNGWFGSSGTCGAFNSDPAGQWFIFALGSGGSYDPSLFNTFHIGETLEGSQYENALAWLARHGEGQPGFDLDGRSPGTVAPQEEHTKDTPWAIILPIAFAIPLAVLVVPAFLRRRGGH